MKSFTTERYYLTTTPGEQLSGRKLKPLKCAWKIWKSIQTFWTDEFSSRRFFSGIIGTISDVKFSRSGRYFSRNYPRVKVPIRRLETIPPMWYASEFPTFSYRDPYKSRSFPGLQHNLTLRRARKKSLPSLRFFSKPRFGEKFFVDCKASSKHYPL